MKDEYPLFIRFYSERIGKPISAFTKDDWRRASLAAGSLIEDLTDIAYPPKKKLGRPPILNALLRKNWQGNTGTKNRRGRPKQTYFDSFSIESLASFISELEHGLPDAQKRCSDAPRNRTELINRVLAALYRKTKKYHSVDAIKVGLRKQRRESVSKKPKSENNSSKNS